MLRRAVSRVPRALLLHQQSLRYQSVGGTEQSQLTSDARNFYNNYGPGGGRDRNWMLAESMSVAAPGGAVDVPAVSLKLTNHHFGISDFSDEIASSADPLRIARELHRLEVNQIDELIGEMGTVRRGEDIVLDAGSGRGGSSLRLWQRCRPQRVHGVTVAEDQAAYATRAAAEAGAGSAVQFHVHNMLRLADKFPAEYFNHVFANETDMYIVDLDVLYKSFWHHLAPGGRFTLATWCCATGHKINVHEQAIDKNYGTSMHTEDEFLSALRGAGFSSIRVRDATREGTPYWQLRSKWIHRSGVEQPFLDGYASGMCKYLFISASKPGPVAHS